SGLPRMKLPPDLAQAHVVAAPAERAGPVPGRERRDLVEEEQLGELPRLQLGASRPATELQPACDPATCAVSPPDAPGIVMHAPAVPVEQAARRVRDELGERRDAILQRHPGGA